MKKTQNRINSPMGLRICLYVMLVMFASCSSCKKELTTEDLVAQLPPATQIGANTFGCLIDGKPYVPDGYTGWSGTYPAMGGGYITDNSGTYTTKNNVVLLTYNSARLNFKIWLAEVSTTRAYPLRYDTKGYATVYIPQNDATSSVLNYTTNAQYMGTVNVTKADTINKIVAGTFEFEAYNDKTGKTIKITNGRFDLKNQ